MSWIDGNREYRGYRPTYDMMTPTGLPLAALSAISLAIYLSIISWRSATSQPHLKARKRVLPPRTLFLDDASVIGCSILAIGFWLLTGMIVSTRMQ